MEFTQQTAIQFLLKELPSLEDGSMSLTAATMDKVLRADSKVSVASGLLTDSCIARIPHDVALLHKRFKSTLS